MEQEQFSRTITSKFEDGTEVFFQKIEFVNKLIIHIQIEEKMDITFDISDNFRSSNPGFLKTDDEAGQMEVEPTVLVGDTKNMKIQVVASQIGSLILKLTGKGAILSIASRWFGQTDDADSQDFDKLMFLLENVKKLVE